LLFAEVKGSSVKLSHNGRFMKMSHQTEQAKELIETSRRITEDSRTLVEETRKLTAELRNILKEIRKMKSK